VETVLYMEFKLVPTALRPPIVATAIRAAISPYSIAVGPERELRSLRRKRIMRSSS
jgi:hypothetical protein